LPFYPHFLPAGRQAFGRNQPAPAKRSGPGRPETVTRFCFFILVANQPAPAKRSGPGRPETVTRFCFFILVAGFAASAAPRFGGGWLLVTLFNFIHTAAFV